jgi:hypothetical protein
MTAPHTISRELSLPRSKGPGRRACRPVPLSIHELCAVSLRSAARRLGLSPSVSSLDLPRRSGVGVFRG